MHIIIGKSPLVYNLIEEFGGIMVFIFILLFMFLIYSVFMNWNKNIKDDTKGNGKKS